MAVVKVVNAPFTAVSNSFVDALTIEELGLLLKMLKFPPDWEFTRNMLCKRFGIGRDKMMKMLKRLREVGALKTVPRRTHDNTTLDGYEWLVFACPDEPVRTPENQGDWKSGLLKIRSPENQYPFIKENKSNKENNTKKKTISTASLISADFAPTDKMVDWARNTIGLPDKTIAIETVKFKNYWESVSGKNALKRDWNKTWQNWILSASQRLEASNGRKNGQGTSIDAGQQALERLKERKRLE